MKKNYVIRDREAGNIIETNIPTEAMANRILKGYEESDKKEGIYVPDFYEVAEAESPETLNDNQEGKFAELLEENRRAKMQIADLMEALKPFAEMTTQFSGVRVRQGGEIFQYNDKKLMVEDFEKALDLMYYLEQHQIK